MATRKTLIRSEAGVRLERIETLAARRKATSTLYCLRTMRPNQPRMMADRDEAEAAFAREVTASMKDPVIRAMVSRDARTKKAPPDRPAGPHRVSGLTA